MKLLTSIARPRRLTVTLSLCAAAALTACGGGGDAGSTDVGVPASCSVGDVNVWFQRYMNSWYYWYALSPSPAPQNYSSLDSYFNALLYTGSSASFPADRWSYHQSTADYNRFFGDGVTMGFGVMVAGKEVEGRPSADLFIRYVEPGSPAAAQGLVRGDRIVSINGRLSSEVITSKDYSALSATAVGQSLSLVVRNAANVDRPVNLTAAQYALVPVPQSTVVLSPNGRRMGYVMVKDMVTQAEAPLSTVFGNFLSQGVSEVMLDLRYNGGGLISTSAKFASYPAAQRTQGAVYSSLLYNDKHGNYNTSFRFDAPYNALALTRVYVLTGPRTCSASEQLINALRPFVEVVTIGATTCGKPVGFLPQADGCGTTYSVVNFESVNASDQGRFFDGFAPTCPVAEDFTQPLGSVTEPLLVAAANHADGRGCPSSSGRTSPLSAALRSGPSGWQGEPGDRFGGMVNR